MVVTVGLNCFWIDSHFGITSRGGEKVDNDVPDRNYPALHGTCVLVSYSKDSSEPVQLAQGDLTILHLSPYFLSHFFVVILGYGLKPWFSYCSRLIGKIENV